MVGDFNDGQLNLTARQVSRLCKAFSNGSSANIKKSKTQLYKIQQSKGFTDTFETIIAPISGIFRLAGEVSKKSKPR